MAKFKHGDRIQVKGAKRTGTVLPDTTMKLGSFDVRVLWDQEINASWVSSEVIELIPKETKVKMYSDFKEAVTAAMGSIGATLFPARSPTGAAFRTYGMAAHHAKLAEKAKKDAMKVLKENKLVHDTYKPGSEVIFEDADLIVRAETSEPRQVFDPETMRATLKAMTPFGQAKIDTIMAAGYKEAKAAVSIKVDTK